jgi:hypothetical protein
MSVTVNVCEVTEKPVFIKIPYKLSCTKSLLVEGELDNIIGCSVTTRFFFFFWGGGGISASQIMKLTILLFLVPFLRVSCLEKQLFNVLKLFFYKLMFRHLNVFYKVLIGNGIEFRMELIPAVCISNDYSLLLHTYHVVIMM